MRALVIGVPAAPLLAGLAVLILGRRYPRASSWAPVVGSALSLLFLVILGGRETGVEALWMQSGGFRLTIGLALNPLSHFFALLVALVALPVGLYAIGYMAGEASLRSEAGQRRFFATFSFFTGAMLALVLADSFLLLFAAWESVGLASFLLIGFWHERESARRAAQKAFLLTRLGDLGFLFAWLMVLLSTGSTQIEAFLRGVRTGAFGVETLTLLALLFFAGSIGKSAQLPLTVWLPAAMAGPAPVSALIHSATMVAAGVYLVLRLFPLFAAAPAALAVLLSVGGLTALFGALIATAQNDLKRVLAWSTASQLGEMMLALGLGGAFAAAYHLATHAAFKATLFLSAGAVDHAAGTRDLWRLGRLARKMPLTALAFGLAALSLAGIPPFSGFWSEEAILGQAAAAGQGLAIFMLALLFLAGIYTSRAGAAAFAAWPGSPGPEARDPGWKMRAGMSLLALAAALLGWSLQGQLADWLPFRRGAEPGALWRLSAIAAGLAGLAFGTWRVRQSGPEPALGRLPRLLQSSLEVLTYAPARLVFAFSRFIEDLEGRVDGLAQALVHLILGAALWIARWEGRLESLGSVAVKGVGALSALTRTGEDGFDRVGFGLSQTVLRLAAETESTGERGLDRVGFGLTQTALGLAAATEATEQQGFSSSLDRFAALFSQGGLWLRRLQTGRIYLYTLGIITWTLLAGLLVILYWITRP